MAFVRLGVFLMWGMLQAVGGSYWILATATLAYLVLFTRAGCASH